MSRIPHSALLLLMSGCSSLLPEATATYTPETAEPGTAEPEPSTPEPEPGTAEPEPSTPEPEPGTAEPEPSTRDADDRRQPEPTRRIVARRRVLGDARLAARLQRTGVSIIGADAAATQALLEESVWVRPDTVRTDLRLISMESGETLAHLRGPTRGPTRGVEHWCYRAAWQRGRPLRYGPRGAREQLGCFGGRPSQDAVRLRSLLSGLASPEAVGSWLGLAVTRSGDALAFARQSPLPDTAEEDAPVDVSIEVVRESGVGSRGSSSRGSSTMWPPRRFPSPGAPFALSGDGTRVAIPTSAWRGDGYVASLWLLTSDADDPGIEVEIGSVDAFYVQEVLFTPRRPGFLVGTSGSQSYVEHVSLVGTAEPLWRGTRFGVLRGAGDGRAVLYPSGEGQATFFSLGPRMTSRTVAIPRGSRLFDVSPSGRWLLVGGGDASEPPAHFTLLGEHVTVSVEVRGERRWTPSWTPQTGIIREVGGRLRVLLYRGDSFWRAQHRYSDNALLLVEMEEP